MRQTILRVAAICVVAMFGLRPIFSSSAASISSEKVIYTFTGGTDGGQPMSDLIFDATGNLYGTTNGGGASGHGTVFELKRTGDGWKQEVLYSFTGSGTDGAFPEAGVIFDKVGNLYGTTALGATAGTVFRLTPDSRGGWKEKIIYNFSCSGSAGCEPYADLVFDAQGNLYGTTEFGGDENSCGYRGCGAVFELTPQTDGSWTETTIHTFTDTDGDGRRDWRSGNAKNQ